MKCERCGYDDLDTGDSSHVCISEADRAKFWGFNSIEEFYKFVDGGGIKYPFKLDTGPKLNETVVKHIKPKYASGGMLPKDTILYGNTGPELHYETSQVFSEKQVEQAITKLTEKIKVAENKIQEKIDPNNASRFDSGKVDWSQVPFQALEGMVRVLEFGAKKYAKGNWANGGGFDHSRVFNSLMRHLVSYQSGEDIDPESGLPHLDHVMCNVMFMGYYKKFPEIFNKDDRIKWGK